ncbi:homeobox protein 3-like [Condylostylus longicornis]|uniref:homeobox protein 3-like n=1 Tax=Condylostylus longicornis TaxID=2530218 RepID=UPI00244DC2A9|nr:homeobox protein 3-like [Condylostylus longicornis]
MPKEKQKSRSERPLIYEIPEKMALNNNNNNVNNNNSANNNRAEFTLTASDLLKDAQRIHEFKGNVDYAQSSFIREVDTLLPLFDNSPDLKQYAFIRIIINKIQGQALDVMRTLGPNSTWENIKGILTNNFGVQQTYHQLYQEALSLKSNSVSDYFNKLKIILSKLNEKFEFDSRKPQEFNPKINEPVIFNTFLNNIDTNLASVIINKNIENLREAYNTLVNLNLIRDKNSNNINKYDNHFNNRNKFNHFTKYDNNKNSKNKFSNINFQNNNQY